MTSWARSGADQWISESKVIRHSRLWYHHCANNLHQRSGKDGKQLYDTLFRLRKITHAIIVLLKPSRRWDFRFSGFDHFLDRFFGFGVCYGLRFLFRSRFPVFGRNKIGFSDSLFDAVRCYSDFSSGNISLNDLNRVHVSIFLWF